MKVICPAGHEADMRQVRSVTCRCGRLFKSMKAGIAMPTLAPMVIARPGQDVITKKALACNICGAPPEKECACGELGSQG